MTLTQWLISKGIDPDKLHVQDCSGISQEEALKHMPEGGGVIFLPPQGGIIPRAWIEAAGK